MLMRIMHLGVLVVLCASPLSGREISPEEEQFFESKIRPVLVRECYSCHSNKTGNARGGLRLDTEQLTHIGGSSGPAVVPGDVDASLLLSAIAYEDFEMPPNRRLPDNVVADFRKWIQMGAPDPRQNSLEPIKTTITKEDIEEAKRSFWAYQPIRSPELPLNGDDSWPVTDVDRFVLARIRDEGLSPAGDAEPHTVLRRLCFDLIGLPPSPEQTATFETMWEVDVNRAVEHVVDRLLDTEQFGERWGRHWLDVVRFAESTGREVNVTYPHAWRYRDYVIDSFNADKPYDQFVVEQLAGDLLPVNTDEEWAEHLIATTFLAIGPKNVNEQNRVQFEADLIDEQIDASTRVFLGMSVACARCHDHKFDAIPQSDYYALAGLFGNMTTYFGNPPSEFGTFPTPQQKRQSSLIRLPIDDPSSFDKRYSSNELEQLKDDLRDALAQVRQTRLGDNSSGVNSNAQLQRVASINRLSAIAAKLAVVDDEGQPISYCMGVQEHGRPRDMPLLVRGEIDQRAQPVPRGFPSVLCHENISVPESSSGRLEFAQWIVGRENPLAARVMVNRIWHHLLGQAIVPSTENFGTTGQFPSHPELLDYLADSFRNTWSVKQLIRQIATSRVYRMETKGREDFHLVDPENRLLWRANTRRIEAEAIRDAMLLVSGELEWKRPRGSEVAKAGFTTVRGGILGDPRELIQSQLVDLAREYRSEMTSMTFRERIQRGIRGQGSNRPDRQQLLAEVTRRLSQQLDMEEAKYRSVYLPVVRNEIPRSMEVFDFADADSIIGTREVSHTANQALFMLNNRFTMQQAESFASRLAAESSRIPLQVEQAFRIAFARSPTLKEKQLSLEFFRDYTLSRQSGEPAALEVFCQSLFAAAEFRLIE